MSRLRWKLSHFVTVFHWHFEYIYVLEPELLSFMSFTLQYVLRFHGWKKQITLWWFHSNKWFHGRFGLNVCQKICLIASILQWYESQKTKQTTDINYVVILLIIFKVLKEFKNNFYNSWTCKNAPVRFLGRLLSMFFFVFSPFPAASSPATSLWRLCHYKHTTTPELAS